MGNRADSRHSKQSNSKPPATRIGTLHESLYEYELTALQSNVQFL